MTTTCPTCGLSLPEKPVYAHRSWTLTIPHKLKSANQHIVNAGSTRWTYKRDRDTWSKWLTVERVNRGIPSAQGKRHVEIVRLYSGRERLWDPDNLAGTSTKGLLDAMVLSGLLVDDSAAFVSVDWSQERAEEGGVRITLREAA